MSLLNLIKDTDIVDFASNYVPEDSSLLDQLFPNIKTPNMKVAYMQAKKNQFKQMAEVHSFDTESKIATRVPFSEKAVEKFLIKEKIQLDEEYARLADELKDNAQVKDMIFNDAGNMSDRVATRARVMKGELLSSGQVTIKENNLNITLNFDVPNGNKTAVDWSQADATDILGDIKTVVDYAASKGYKLTRAVTSSKIISKIQMDTAVRSAMFGANATKIPTIDELNAFIYSMYKVRFAAFDDMYQYEQANGTKVTQRYTPENKIMFFGGAVTETLGKGIYGITPTERNARLNASQSKNIYIMNSMWDTPDPVATWTKAEGVFVPVLGDPDGLFIVTATLE